MTDARSLALPADLAGLVDRLRDQARATVRASQMLAEDKTIRNRIAGDADANYAGVTGYATPEWQAANAITALSARVAELEAARDAAIRKHSVAAAHSVIARRLALSEAMAICEARELQQENDNGAANTGGAAECARDIQAVLSALLEGGRG